MCENPCAENQILYPIFHTVSRRKKVDTENDNSSCILILKRKRYRLGRINGVPALSSERVYLVTQHNFNTPDIRECDRGIQIRGRRPIIAESPGQV